MGTKCESMKAKFLYKMKRLYEYDTKKRKPKTADRRNRAEGEREVVITKIIEKTVC